MLTGKSIVIIGGDARHVEMMKHLIEKDATLYAVGYEELEEEIDGLYLTDVDHIPQEKVDAIILPITGLDKEGYAEAHFAETSPHITKDWLEGFRGDCILFTGIMTPYLKELLSFKERIIPLFNRDDVAIYNSIPTAEGTVMFAIQHTDFTIHNSNVTILGLGRVGKTLIHTFKGLGANVSVYSRHEDELARIFEYQASPIRDEELEDHLKDCDILINTIPALFVTPSLISSLPINSLIIDLASKPGGVDFRFAKKRGIKSILAPGLPGLVAPKTAGVILARVIHNIIMENQ
ncbi:dipicolinic acid synthetase subunit A [Aquisalibacillus elongatus]|uniref:Dipicolinate synthase subunit A n=1 Tax=Aquisalibacillus elongatus TaxID=485577 RepID=A0A3N5BDZ4_9BACI|nr:dipicolinic acid synthetase subunit A [Aquisalibacillus elongatus]RPF55944.1 dipicolinate synthase subunit A [Aquisalibacillus elongatus]